MAVLDLNREAAEAVAKEIGGLGVACDIADAKSGEAAVAQDQGPWRRPRPDQCRGHPPARPHPRPRGPDAPRDIAKVIEINLIGSFNMMRLAAAEMTTLPALTMASGA